MKTPIPMVSMLSDLVWLARTAMQSLVVVAELIQNGSHSIRGVASAAAVAICSLTVHQLWTAAVMGLWKCSDNAVQFLNVAV